MATDREGKSEKSDLHKWQAQKTTKNRQQRRAALPPQIKQLILLSEIPALNQQPNN